MESGWHALPLDVRLYILAANRSGETLSGQVDPVVHRLLLPDHDPLYYEVATLSIQSRRLGIVVDIDGTLPSPLLHKAMTLLNRAWAIKWSECIKQGKERAYQFTVFVAQRPDFRVPAYVSTDQVLERVSESIVESRRDLKAVTLHTIARQVASGDTKVLTSACPARGRVQHACPCRCM